MAGKKTQGHAAPKKDGAKRLAFGIDIGGSGIKGCPVDLDTGEFAADRLRIPTPQPAKPKAVVKTVAQLVEQFDLPADVPVGIGFPAPILHGVVPFVANLDDAWEGVNVPQIMSEKLGRPVTAVNDADAAGIAEARYGAAAGVEGTVIVTTLGTGIGSALFIDGVMVPNTELGHLEIDGHDAETRASDGARSREDLSWKAWAKRLQRYYSELEKLFAPDLIVVSGGVSKKSEKYLPHLSLRCPIVPAKLLNRAGIVGAAALAAERAGQ